NPAVIGVTAQPIELRLRHAVAEAELPQTSLADHRIVVGPVRPVARSPRLRVSEHASIDEDVSPKGHEACQEAVRRVPVGHLDEQHPARSEPAQESLEHLPGSAYVLEHEGVVDDVERMRSE